MFTRKEIESAIKEYEAKASSFSDCEKLAAFYTVLAYKYGEQEPKEQRAVYTETVIDNYGDTEFYSAIRGQKAADVWDIMDELMANLQLFNPKLYNATIRELDSL